MADINHDKMTIKYRLKLLKLN